MAADRGLLADVVPSSCVDGPGNRFVVFVQGCTFNCLACHNPQTIARRPVAGSRWVSVEEVLERLRDASPFVSGVTVSGGEATCQWPFVLELFRRVKRDPILSRLSTLVDTNGDAGTEVWDALAPWMDGAMVDLKVLDPELHLLLTGRSNGTVLASIRHLVDIDRLTEVRLLLIPGINDSHDLLTRTAAWLNQHAPGVPIRLNGFRRAGTRPIAHAFNEATSDHLEAAQRVLAGAGIPRDLISWQTVPTPAPRSTPPPPRDAER